MHPGVQAEEEGRPAAASPSKAALKRARKKAAATAAAAAPGLATEVAENSLTHDSSAASTVHSPTLIGNGAAAAQSSMQQLRLQDGDAARAGTPAASRTVPGWMVCPLTHTILVDPVLCTGDGHSYERSAIVQWLAASDTSPVTGQPLASRDLLPNHALRSIIAIHAAQARSSQQ